MLGGAVSRLERGDSRRVLADAFRVFYDAAKMMHEEEAGYRIEFARELTRKERASRFRAGESGSRAVRKRRGRSGIVLR